MTPRDARELALVLEGCVFGAVGVFVLAALAVWFDQVRRALREGTPLAGEGIERAKRRGDL